jgi:hypothetical protein
MSRGHDLERVFRSADITLGVPGPLDLDTCYFGAVSA